MRHSLPSLKLLVLLLIMQGCKPELGNGNDNNIGVYCVMDLNKDVQEVILMESSASKRDTSYLPVQGAMVEILNRDSVYTFTEVEPGVYQYCFTPAIGQAHTLHITTPDREEIKASVYVQNKPKFAFNQAYNIPVSFGHKPDWERKLYNAPYPGIALESMDASEDYYVLIRALTAPQSFEETSVQLPYLATNSAHADPITKMETPEVEFPYPQNDNSINLSIHKDFILIKNPHEEIPARLLTEQFGEDIWDNGFFITAGPNPSKVKRPVRYISADTRSIFDDDLCNMYMQNVSITHLSGRYVDCYKDQPGFPNHIVDPTVAFRKTEYSNIKGGTGIFAVNLGKIAYQRLDYQDDLHNQAFREHYLASFNDTGDPLSVIEYQFNKCEKGPGTPSEPNVVTFEALGGDTLKVHHKGKFLCGTEVVLDVKSEGYGIYMNHKFIGNPAYCSCPAEYFCKITGMKEGEYVIVFGDSYLPIPFTFKKGNKKTVTLEYVEY